MGTLLSIIIAAVIIIAIAIFATLISLTSNPAPPPPPPQLTNPVGFMYQCRDYKCDVGLECDSISAVCKEAAGSKCRSQGDCATDNYCSGATIQTEKGICVSNSIPPGTTTNKPNSPCPCPTNMKCTIDSKFEYPVCKLNGNNPCTQNNQCSSNVCENGVCTSGIPAGGLCNFNSDCKTGLYCSLNYCQDQGVTTGQQGSVCTLSGCVGGLSCVNDICEPAVFGLGFPCNSTNLCSQPLSCTQILDAASICEYHYPDPNSCPCVSQYTCSNNKCLAPATFPCRDSSQCSTSSSGVQGTCGVFNNIYRFLYKQSTGTFTDPNKIVGSYEVLLEVVSTNGFNAAFIGVPTLPLKLTGFSSSTQGDRVYAVIPDVGVIDLDGNTLVSGDIGGPGKPTGGSLIDACITSNRSGFVVYGESSNGTDYFTVLYSYVNGFLTPYNVTSGVGFLGTQYSSGEPLVIETISVNNSGYVLIWAAGYAYVLPKGETGWRLLKNSLTGDDFGQVSLPMFYNDTSNNSNIPIYENVSYVAPILGGNLLQFNGDVSGGIYPLDRLGNETYNVLNYSLWSDSTRGVENGILTMITKVNQFGSTYALFSGVGGTIYKLPHYVNETCKVLSLGGSVYLYTNTSCAYTG